MIDNEFELQSEEFLKTNPYQEDQNFTDDFDIFVKFPKPKSIMLKIISSDDIKRFADEMKPYMMLREKSALQKSTEAYKE